MKYFHPHQPDWRKTIWPVALAATVAWCSARALPHWGQPVFNSDKVIHFLVFGLMATLVARIAAVQRTRPLGIYAAILAVSVFGATDEIHQHFTPGRSMDFNDWVADTLGAAVATTLYARWSWYRWLLETPVWRLFGKRRVEIGAEPCLIPGDGTGGSPATNRRPALTGRAA